MNSKPFSGKMKHVRMYTRILTADEIAVHYSGGCGTNNLYLNSLVLWDPMNDFLPAAVLDLSSYGASGVETGTTMVRVNEVNTTCTNDMTVAIEMNGKGYRFGFNGKENDNEIKGEGNSLDFGARIYDPRIGRFLSTDPREKEYAWQSPYAYIRNNPINIPDFNGEGDPVSNPKIRATSGSLNRSRFMMESRKNEDGSTRNHYGVDVLAAKGTAIQTMTAGEVVEVVAKFKPGQYAKNSFGNTVTVCEETKDGKTTYTKYGHLDKVNVKVGQKIPEGAVIGVAGNTGNAGDPDGPGPKKGIPPEENHVHIEASTTPIFKPASKKGGVGTRINPEQFMDTKFDDKGKPIEDKKPQAKK